MCGGREDFVRYTTVSRFSFYFYFNVTRCVGLRCLWVLVLEFMKRECAELWHGLDWEMSPTHKSSAQ